MARPRLRHAHDGPPSADRRARPVRGVRRHLRQLDALDGDLAAHLRIPCDLHRREATRAGFRHRAITIEYELFACHVTPSPFELRLLSRSIAKLGPRVPFESKMRQRTTLNARTTRMHERPRRVGNHLAPLRHRALRSPYIRSRQATTKAIEASANPPTMTHVAGRAQFIVQPTPKRLGRIRLASSLFQ